MNATKIEFANTLRAVAALSVILGHYFGVFWFNPSAVKEMTGMPGLSLPVPSYVQWVQIPHLNWAAFGVALFFIVSGFVIPFSFRTYGSADFLIARFFRIYPTYWMGLSISLVVMVLCLYLAGGSFPHNGSQLMIGYALGSRDLFWSKSIDGVVWTLEIELKFYLICALIRPWLRHGSLKVLIVPIALTSCVVALAYELLPASAGTSWYWVAWSSPHLVFMFVGVMFNFYYRQKLNSATAAIIIGILLAFFWWSLTFGFFAVPAIVWSYALATVIFALAMRYSNVFDRLPTARFWAAISYPLYVVHAVTGYALLSLMLAFGMKAWLSLVLTFALVAAISYALHVIVERPSHELGRAIADQLRTSSRPEARAPVEVSSA